MFWRWTEGLAFMDYHERVEALMQKNFLIQGNDIVSEMRDYARLKVILQKLGNEQSQMVASGQFPMISSIMRKLNISEDLISTYHITLLERDSDENDNQ
jgi:hypothetical protein